MRKGAKEVQFAVGEKAGIVSGLLLKPADARALLVLALGALRRWHARISEMNS